MPHQEQELCNMVNNTMRLTQIQTAISEVNGIIANINSASLSAIHRVHIYKESFEMNSDRAKELR